LKKHQAGFVNIVGLPNVGKSTLLNALVGKRLAIVSPKAQTTRHRLLGLLNSEDFQIVFSDTPGFINQPAYQLHQSMNQQVKEALDDADVLLFITDKFQTELDQQFLINAAKYFKQKCIVVFNKIDLVKEDELEAHRKKWERLLPDAFFFPISAEKKIALNELIQLIVSLLPESPEFYPKDELTNRPLRFFVSEIIREKIFFNYEKEIPYSTEVVVEEYKEGENMDRIRCAIYVERESQKPIIIGKEGKALTVVGRQSREHIESFIGKKVFLELRVKVRDKWRNNDKLLKKLGF
jgi:GTP-binding protein Era